MLTPRVRPQSPAFVYLLSPLLIALTTWALYTVQQAATLGNGSHNFRPYTIVFVLPIALLTALGGRGSGLLTLGLSACSLFYVLLPPAFTFRARGSSDIAELLFLLLVGGLMVVAMDALRRNGSLLVETKDAQARLSQSEMRKGAILEAALDCIITMDGEGRIVEFNPAAERTFGYARAHAVGQMVADLIIPTALREKHRQGLTHYLATGEGPVIDQRIEITATRADGAEFPIELAITPLRSGDMPFFTAYVRDITERRQAEEEIQDLLAQERALAEREATVNRVGQALRKTLDPAAVQSTVVTLLGEALRADRCYYVTYDFAHNSSHIAHDWHRADLPSIRGEYTPTGFLQPLIEQFAHSPSAQVIEDARRSAFPAETIAGLERLGLRSSIRVPLLDAGELVAVLAVAMANSPRAWTADEVAVVEAVATQTRAAIEAARVRLREHNIATSLQDALLPGLPESIPGLELDAYYKAALDESSIGGDFFDVFMLDKGHVALAVGDLSGKGLAAAAQVATVRNMLRYSLYRQRDVAEAITELNATIASYDLLIGFATLFVGVYDLAAHRLIYVSCGQEPALLRRAATGAVEQLSPTGPILGADASGRFTEQSLTLDTGDALAVFTDGLTEAGTSRSALLGINGVAALLAEIIPTQADGLSRAASLKTQLITRVAAYAGGGLQDDVCLLVAVVSANDCRPQPE